VSIWKVAFSVDDFKQMNRDCAVEHLGIEITEMGDDFLRGTMPVDHRTVQPFRMLHGGASVLLAESLGSLASFLCVEKGKYYCVGQSINANHIRGVKEGGTVTGTAKAVHIGRRSHVWEIKITDNQNKLVCVCRLTMAVIPV